MTRWEVFRLLCDCLAPALSRRRPRIPEASVPWALVVEAAGDHMIAPALGWCLRDEERVPGDVRTCFATLLELNRRRNDIILEALRQAVASLNAAGVTPMLLKGAAALADDLYPDAGMRVVGDIDLLVPASRLADADAALHAAGFTGRSARESFDADPHHLPLRVHADLQVGVELHKLPVPRVYGALMDVETCLDRARRFDWQQLRVLIPTPTDRVAHCIVHGQIVDGHYWRGVPRLRQLFELALLLRRHGPAADAAELDRRFRCAGYEAVLSETFALSEALLERPGAESRSARAARAMRRARGAVERPGTRRWIVYWRLVARNSRRVAANPGFLLRALRPSFWALELAGIRRRIRVPRW